MFTRRVPRTFLQNARELVWPQMGWMRASRYYWHRLRRLDDTPARIARGIATGVAISFVPLPGTHFIQAAILCVVLRGNILAGLISTWVGNPWTFPFMWYVAYLSGFASFEFLGWQNGMPMPAHFSLDDLWVAFKNHPYELMVPWIFGGYICMAAIWPLTYFIVVPFIRLAHRRRHEHRLQRLKELHDLHHRGTE